MIAVSTLTHRVLKRVRKMLTERQKQILLAVVKDYIESAKPVGSRTLSKKYFPNLSPATIRNEMADLEEMGLFYQPHTSAGRVPTSRAYRYYVNAILDGEEELFVDEHLFIEFINKTKEEVESLLRRIGKLLSKTTDYLSVVVALRSRECAIKKVELVKLDSMHALMIIVTEGGWIHHKVLYLREDIDVEELEELERYINERISGRALGSLNENLLRELLSRLEGYRTVYFEAARALREVKEKTDKKIYLEGRTNILKLPEFKDVEKIRIILEVLEEEDFMAKMLTEVSREGDISVVIGDENPVEKMRECSLVTASYSLGGKIMGVLGIIGPTRMDYKKVISIMKAMTQVFSYFEEEGS
ncbi:MAG: Heat-inducible transcription repressor hrcA [bacterium 42_11]|nr:MAG: Heat-inducible transcription repressor hrcA [bacterium 42_11]